MPRRSVIALDISDSSIKAAELKFADDRWKVQRFGEKAIVQGKGIRSAHMAEEIKGLFDELKLNPKGVLVSINGADATFKLLKLPPVRSSKVNLAQLIKYELMEMIPFSDVVYDYHVAKQGEAETLVPLIAIRRDRLNEYLDLMERAGVKPRTLIPSFLVLYHTLLANGTLDQSGGSTVAVRIGRTIADMAVVKEYLLSFARSFPIRVGTRPETFLNDLRNTLVSLLKSEDGDDKELVIISEDERLPLGLAVEEFQNALPYSNFRYQVIDEEFTIGLAFSLGHDPHLLPVNLLKPVKAERRERKLKELKRRLFLASPCITLVLLSTLAFLLHGRINSLEEKLSLKEEVQGIVDRRGKEISSLKGDLKNLRLQAEAIDWANDLSPAISYSLYKIASSTPDGIWLKEIHSPELPQSGKKVLPISSLFVVGYARSQSEVSDFKDRLKSSGCFSVIQQQDTEEKVLKEGRFLCFKLYLRIKGR